MPGIESENNLLGPLSTGIECRAVVTTDHVDKLSIRWSFPDRNTLSNIPSFRAALHLAHPVISRLKGALIQANTAELARQCMLQ